MNSTISNLSKAEILAEALPYIKEFQDSIIVIKYGGNAMVDNELKIQFAQDVALLKLIGFHPVIVHGGGPQINDLLTKIGKKGKFINGLRVTDDETMSIVEMVLSGKVNKEIVSLINLNGAVAIGITGKDGHCIKAEKLFAQNDDTDTKIDLGQVGAITEINTSFLSKLITSDYIPVIAPIGVGENGETFNINADIVAGNIAINLKAQKLIMLTNIKGVEDKNGRLLPKLTPDKIQQLKSNGTLSGGMLPKITAALEAAQNGIEAVHIIDGRERHSLLLELFTNEGIGTVILSKEENN